MIQIEMNTVDGVCKSISSRVKSRRLELNLTQLGFSNRAGVNVETYRKFERTGEISLKNLVKLAFALNLPSDFDTLFLQKQYQSLDEIIASENKPRRRGQKK